MQNVLDNMMWGALSGAQRHLSAGTETIRRYAKGFSPIVGFADLHNPDLESLIPFCDASEQFYCEGWTGPVPSGWQIIAESTMVRMVWTGDMPDAGFADDAQTLDASHVTQAMHLAKLTNPGPFGVRTLELGDYYGYFDGGELVAMAGERMHANQYREVSGVCTHPDFQGRGLAGKLMKRLVRQQLLRQQIPFLHAMSSNHGACRLYEKLGFSLYREIPVRVIALD